jgi:hypothetical protein
MVASFMREASEAEDGIPVPKGPVELW